jgi:hypothetical protein
MAWTVISPALGDTISDSLANIRGNFVVLAAAWDGDHETLTGTGTSSTKHVQVTLPEFAISPAAGPTTLASEGAVFTRDIAGRPSLFYRQESDGTEIQLTGVDPVVSSAGQSTLPGGLIMKWGSTTISSTANTNLTFPVAFGTSIFNAQLTSQNSSQVGTIQLVSLALDKLVAKASGTNFPYTVYWSAIGV